MRALTSSQRARYDAAMTRWFEQDRPAGCQGVSLPAWTAVIVASIGLRFGLYEIIRFFARIF